MSLNRGPCGGVLQGLSHSDSYTWAVENRRPGSGRSMNREGSFSSLSSQEMSLSNEITDYTHTESQVCIQSRNLLVALLFCRSSQLNTTRLLISVLLFYYLFYMRFVLALFPLVLHSSANIPHHVHGEKPVRSRSGGTIKSTMRF